jgi:inner membrane transporter RhtA
VPPPLLVLGAIVSTQVGAAAGTTLFEEVGPAGACLLRIAAAALVMAAIVRPRFGRHASETLRVVAAFGVALGVMNLSFYEALDRLPLGIAVTVEFVGPLGVAIVGSRRPLDLLWVVLAGGGIVLLANPGGAETIDGVGLAFALAAGGGWAAYIVLAGRVGGRVPGAEGVALAMAVGTLVPLVPGVAEAGGTLLRPEVLAVGAAAGILSSAIPYTLETEALRRMPRHVFSVLLSIEPAVAALVGFVALGQPLVAREVVAIVLVVAASAGALSHFDAPPET